MPRRILGLVLLINCCTLSSLGNELKDTLAPVLLHLTAKIPLRPSSAMTGSQFANAVSGLEGLQREQAIEAQLAHGNLPGFLRNLKPVQLAGNSEDGRAVVATMFVMPDYLAIGSDDDFLLIPMDLHTASKIASEFGFILPTKKMVDAIFQQSTVHLAPQPMTPGPLMRSTAYYSTHDRTIKGQRKALQGSPDAIISGHKKDIVLTSLLARNPGRIAIYGWHRPSGQPIQPLSTVHGAEYADYSHGARLVSEVVLIDGTPCSVYDALAQPLLADILSDEGTIPEARQLMHERHPAPGDYK